jgi:hypothetical protein
MPRLICGSTRECGKHLHAKGNEMALRAIGLLAVFLFLVHPTRADTFAFNFSSNGISWDYSGGAVSGEGSFTTDPDAPAPEGGGYLLTSLTGEMNGQPMDLVSGQLCDIQCGIIEFGDFNQDELIFTVDGAPYSIFESNGGPLSGYVLWLNGEYSGIELSFDLVDLSTVSTPEPSTILMMSFGLGLLIVCGSRERKKRAATTIHSTLSC